MNGMKSTASMGKNGLQYSAVQGFFLQNDPSTDADSFDFMRSNFGLINREYATDAEFDPDRKKTQWQRFEYYLQDLNRASDHQTHYKVLFLGRHGQGWHNFAEIKYGTKEWDDYWSKLDGDGNITWADAHLTNRGIKQAKLLQDFWSNQITNEEMPAPQSYYTSPMFRCLQTTNFTFSGLKLPKRFEFKPIVKELLRETLGVHTCDRRSTRTAIQKAFPTYAVEGDFTEDDRLWQADHRETDQEGVARLKELLDEILAQDENEIISFTSHGGAIGYILSAVGHRRFGLAVAAVIPVFVRIELR